MTVHHNIFNLPVFTRAVVTIGTFDGVHAGHQQIIELMKAEAKAIGGETVIITFHPHPRHIISLDNTPIYLLNTIEERIDLLQNHGIDHLVIVPFTNELANQSAEDFIKEFLVHSFHPHTIIIGYDHRFGKDRKGNYQLLEQKASEHSYKVKEIPVHILKDSAISSTKIRQALLSGDVETANQFLNYDYFFTGLVVIGNRLGRTIGYPTANLHIEDTDKLIPGDGVYIVTLTNEKWGSVSKRGMMNIGMRPTVNGKKRSIEVHIFDFNEDIYREELQITLKKYLRGEVKFDGIESLKKQLSIDKEASLSFFSNLKN